MLPLKDGNITLVNEVVITALVKSRILLVVIIKLIQLPPPEELADCIIVLAKSPGTIFEMLSSHGIIITSHVSNLCLASKVLIP